MATILSVDAAHDDGEFPPLTSEQGTASPLLCCAPPVIRAGITDRVRPVVGVREAIITGAARTARLGARVAAAEAYREGSLISKCHRQPSSPEGTMGAKPGANVFRPRPTQRDPLRAFAQVRKRDPRFGFAQIRACPPGLLRDEEAVGSSAVTRLLVRRIGDTVPGVGYRCGLCPGFGTAGTTQHPVLPRFGRPLRKSAAMRQRTAGQACLSRSWPAGLAAHHEPVSLAIDTPPSRREPLPRASAQPESRRGIALSAMPPHRMTATGLADYSLPAPLRSVSTKQADDNSGLISGSAVLRASDTARHYATLEISDDGR
jgi:hypothetical protein